jgi:hypothetical protein
VTFKNVISRSASDEKSFLDIEVTQSTGFKGHGFVKGTGGMTSGIGTGGCGAPHGRLIFQDARFLYADIPTRPPRSMVSAICITANR